MNEKTKKELIEFNEGWINDLKKSLDNPVQKLIGVEDIHLKILELKTEIEILKKK